MNALKIAASLVLGLCWFHPAIAGDQEADIEAAKAAVAYIMKDPDSAQFRSIETFQAPNGSFTVCGEVNAKNSYGAYAGFQRFYYLAGTAHVDDGSPQFRGFRDIICSPDE